MNLSGLRKQIQRRWPLVWRTTHRRRVASLTRWLHWMKRDMDRLLERASALEVSESNACLRAVAASRMADAQIERLMRVGDIDTNDIEREWACTVFVGKNLFAELSSRLPVEDQKRFIARRFAQLVEAEVLAVAPVSQIEAKREL